MKAAVNLLIVSVFFPILLSSCLATIATVTLIKTKNRHKGLQLSASVPEVDESRPAKLLTAFYEVDNNLPSKAKVMYKKAKGKDGMSLVFSHELNPETVESAYFAVTTENGNVYEVEAASLLLANEAFELRTVVLIGEYGNYPDNPPVAVEIVGDLMSRTGVNFKGQTKEIIPLPDGPILSYAEYFQIADDYPYVEKGPGCDCPREQTRVVVKTVWSGGVMSGEEGEDKERDAFQVDLVQGADTITVTPFQLADLADDDNNIDLCLKEAGIPIRVTVMENTTIDLSEDPNPQTAIEILSRW